MTIDITPDVQGTIEFTRNRSFIWRDVLGELIDNAFDAGATVAKIAIDGKALTVEDNGSGCEDLEAMLTMGRHTRKSTTRLGRYGVGLKDSALWVGGPTRIRSVHKDTLRTIHVDWDRLNAWRLPDPDSQPADGELGTKIKFDRMARKFPEGKAFADLVAQIGYIYSPAIKDGKQISFRRGRSPIVLAEAYKLPLLTDVVDCKISVGEKTARVHIGVVPEGHQNPKPGINYTHGFRIIIPETALGCGGHGSSRIAGWVSLDHGWKLTRNKDDLSDHKEEIAEAVYAAIKDIVAKAERQSMTLASASLAINLTQMFRGVAGVEDSATKRDAGSKHQGPKKIHGLKDRRKTKNTKSAGTFRVEFHELDDGSIGRVDMDGGVITLADNHPAVVEAKHAQNTTALLFAAVFLFAARNCDTGTPLLPFMRNGEIAKKVELVAGRLLNQDHRQALRLVSKGA